jgi:hypothetical protein
MAKTTRRTTRRRTVRDELSAPPIPPADDSVNGEESMSEFHDNTEPEASAPKTQRLSLPLTSDGSAVDWERVRNADKARTVLGLGGPASSESANDGIFGADMLGLALDMISSGLVSVARAGGYTAESSEVLRFAEQEKAAIIPRAAKVLGKHAPALGRWEDEITLATTITIILAGKLMTLKKAASVTKFPRAVESPTPEPSPTTVPTE